MTTASTPGLEKSSAGDPVSDTPECAAAAAASRSGAASQMPVSRQPGIAARLRSSLGPQYP